MLKLAQIEEEKIARESIEKILEMDLETLSKLTDTQMLEYLGPALHVVEPLTKDQVKALKKTTQDKPKKLSLVDSIRKKTGPKDMRPTSKLGNKLVDKKQEALDLLADLGD